MILYFADRSMNILGMASTKLRNGLLIREDEKESDVDTGSASLEFDLCYEKGRRLEAERLAEPGNYILRHSGTDDEFYTIIDSDTDGTGQAVSVSAEDAGLELLNTIVGAFEAAEAHPIIWYIDMFAGNSGFTVNINEISDRSRKLSWDGEGTALERLLSIATQFDAEIGFSFDIQQMKVAHQYINIYRKRGRETNRELRVGREIASIRVKKSVANLATGLEVTGGTPEGADNPITLAGYTYDDGDIYVSGTQLLSRKALEKWSRYQWDIPADEGTDTDIISDGLYYIKLASSPNKVIDVSGGSTADKANVQIYTLNSTTAQQWRLTYNSSGDYYSVINVKSGKAMDVAGGSKAEGANVQQYQVNNSKAQRWAFRKRSEGMYSIHTAINDKALDLAGGQTADGTNIRVYTYNVSNAQLWVLEKVSASDVGAGHIIKTFSHDSLTQAELCNRAIAELRRICDTEVNYEVEMATRIEDLQLGDTINLIDSEEELYLSARVLKITEGEADNKQTVTLGNYLLKKG